MELPGGGGVWLAPSPSPPGPAVPDRHDEHGVDTFIWPKLDTSTWPPVGTFSWPRTHIKAQCHSKFRAKSRLALLRARRGLVGLACHHIDRWRRHSTQTARAERTQEHSGQSPAVLEPKIVTGHDADIGEPCTQQRRELLLREASVCSKFVAEPVGKRGTVFAQIPLQLLHGRSIEGPQIANSTVAVWCSDVDESAGAQHPRQFPQAARWVADMLNNVVIKHDVETIVSEREIDHTGGQQLEVRDIRT